MKRNTESSNIISPHNGRTLLYLRCCDFTSYSRNCFAICFPTCSFPPPQRIRKHISARFNLAFHIVANVSWMRRVKKSFCTVHLRWWQPANVSWIVKNSSNILQSTLHTISGWAFSDKRTFYYRNITVYVLLWNRYYELLRSCGCSISHYQTVWHVSIVKECVGVSGLYPLCTCVCNVCFSLSIECKKKKTKQYVFVCIWILSSYCSCRDLCSSDVINITWFYCSGSHSIFNSLFLRLLAVVAFYFFSFTNIFLAFVSFSSPSFRYDFCSVVDFGSHFSYSVRVACAHFIHLQSTLHGILRKDDVRYAWAKSSECIVSDMKSFDFVVLGLLLNQLYFIVCTVFNKSNKRIFALENDEIQRRGFHFIVVGYLAFCVPWRHHFFSCWSRCMMHPMWSQHWATDEQSILDNCDFASFANGVGFGIVLQI